MAIKPTKPTVPPAPSRANPGSDFSAKADTFAAFQTTLATYMDDTAEFVDERADEALAAALGGTLPSLTGRALNVLRVNAGGTAAEFRTPAQTRADIAAAPLPTTSAGVGQFLAINPATGAAAVLPAGGTWLYSILRTDNSTGGVTNGAHGIAAGGTTVGTGTAGQNWSGWAWRQS